MRNFLKIDVRKYIRKIMEVNDQKHSYTKHVPGHFKIRSLFITHKPNSFTLLRSVYIIYNFFWLDNFISQSAAGGHSNVGQSAADDGVEEKLSSAPTIGPRISTGIFSGLEGDESGLLVNVEKDETFLRKTFWKGRLIIISAFDNKDIFDIS